MRAAFLLLFILTACACGSSSEETNNNHGYGFEYDVQGQSGLKLRHSTLLPKDFTVEYFEAVFSEVKRCAGVEAPAPFVVIVPVSSIEKNSVGKYMRNPSLILVDAGSLLIFRHEVIHYLLDYSTGNQDAEHTSRFFVSMRDGGCAA